MKCRKSMIHPSDPLRHAVIIGLFGLEHELEIGPAEGCSKAVRPTQTTIRAQPTQREAAVTNEPHPHVAASLGSRRPEDCADDFVVQVGRAQCQWCLLQHQHAEVIRRWLAESHYARRIAAKL